MALRQHSMRQEDERKQLGSAWREHGLVFPSEVGTPMSPSNMWRGFQRLLRRAGLPPMRFHDLRHSCGTFLALQGVPMRTAMEILGHSTITTTAHIYMQVLDVSKREAAVQMEALLTSSPRAEEDLANDVRQ
jgi:integrase